MRWSACGWAQLIRMISLIEAVFLVKRLLWVKWVKFFKQLLTTKARHSIMLMILSKLYQDIKQEKNRRLVGFCFSLHTKAASRGNLFFVYSIYAKLDADWLIGLLPGSQWEDHSKSPFVFATVKKKLYFLHPKFQGATWFLHPKFQGAAWFVRDLWLFI